MILTPCAGSCAPNARRPIFFRSIVCSCNWWGGNSRSLSPGDRAAGSILSMIGASYHRTVAVDRYGNLR